VGEVFPRAGHTGYLGLTAQLAFGTDLARHAGNFSRETVELIHHSVDRILEVENLPLHIDRDFSGKVTSRDCRGDVGDIADLAGEVGRHQIDVVGKVLPRAGHAAHLSLAPQFSFGADFAGNARNLRGESVELVYHRIDRVFQLQNLAFHIDCNLA